MIWNHTITKNDKELYIRVGVTLQLGLGLLGPLSYFAVFSKSFVAPLQCLVGRLPENLPHGRFAMQRM